MKDASAIMALEPVDPDHITGLALVRDCLLQQNGPGHLDLRLTARTFPLHSLLLATAVHLGKDLHSNKSSTCALATGRLASGGLHCVGSAACDFQTSVIDRALV